MTRGGSRLLRIAIVAIVLLVLGYHLSTRNGIAVYVPGRTKQETAPLIHNQSNEEQGSAEEANHQELENKKEPAEDNSSHPPAFEEKYKRANATFVSLARNEDLWELVGSIRQVEDRFNRKFHYDWVFLNDKPFDDNFKSVTTSLVSGQTRYGLIPKDHWSYPSWIDQDKARESRKNMQEKKIIYGGSESYRHMCRFESGFFWRDPALDDYKYYWRVEPSIKLHCDIDYDVFKFMEEKKIKYGFTISLYEYIETIPTLWNSTRKFIDQHPDYVAPDSLMKFVSDDNGESYNKCHFWSNFEVADLDFWRSKPYQEYFDFLDREGGFFYERWGDAPVHSIGASLFLNKDEIHFFEDIGYFHVPFNSCPASEEDRLSKRCVCNPKDSFTWKGYSCTPKFYDVKGMPRPAGWSQEH